MVIDEVATIAALLLVEVSLGDGLVGEELVLAELEDEAEARAVKVLHADIGEVLEGLLVSVGDHLGQRNLVLHRGKPELWDTSGSGLSRLGLLLLLVVILLDLASLNFSISRLGLSIDDGSTFLIERRELGEILLLQL